MPRFVLTALCAACLLCRPAPAGVTVIHVDDAAPAAGDGASWETAYRFLSDALAEAATLPAGDAQVLVAGGSYIVDRSEATPDGTGDRSSTFAVPDGAALIGGHLGLDAMGGEDPYTRDLVAHPSVLDGEIGFTVLADNALHVMTAPGSGLIDGVTAMYGWTEGGGSDGLGGGLRAEGTHATALVVRDCTFVDNFAEAGGGAALIDSNATIESCLFLLNSGSGLRIEGGAPSILTCRFDGNQSPQIGGGAWSENSDPTFDGCTFVDNGSVFGGGALIGFGGGTVTGCTFEGNVAQGGGLYLQEATTDVLHCTFAMNSSGTAGGAIYVFNSMVSVFDCTFTGNLAVALGGAAMNDGATVTYDDCMFSANMSEVGQGGAMVNLSADVTCTNVQFRANEAAVFGGAVYSFTPGFSVGASLFCANLPDDISGSYIDLGRNEFVAECPDICPADVDGDGTVAVGDLLSVLAAWGPCFGCAADIDGDGVVAVGDLLAVLAAWGDC